jgi:adenine-specific DNA methylase
MLKKTKAKYLIFFQPDGNCDIKKIFEFNRFIKNNYDLIIASRYLKNAKSHDDDLISSFGNFIFTKIVNILFARPNAKLTDALVGYRAIKIKTLKELNIHSRKNYEFLEKLLKVGLSWDIVMTCKILADKSKAYIEFSCSEPKRIGGVVKKKIIKWGISYLVQIMQIYFYEKLANFK